MLNYTELRLTLHHETEAALLVSDTGDDSDAVWIPKSQVKHMEEIPGGEDQVEVVIPDWLATEKGLT